MVRCRDHHGVDVLVFEQSPEIGVELRATADELSCSFEPRLKGICDSNNLRSWKAMETARMDSSHQTKSDDANTDALVCAKDSLGGDRGDGSRGLSNSLDKLSSFHGK